MADDSDYSVPCPCGGWLHFLYDVEQPHVHHRGYVEPEVPTVVRPAVTVPASGFRAYCAECGWTSGGIDIDKSFADEKREAHNNIVHESSDSETGADRG